MRAKPALPSVTDFFLKWETENPEAIFLRQPKDLTWTEYSWKAVGDEARRIAARLAHHGYQRGDRIAILSQNCAEWIVCDLAILMGGFVSVPLYANVNADTLTSILEHSGSRFLFVGKLFQKDWENVESAIPASVRTVSMPGYEKPGITPWKEFMAGNSLLLPWVSPASDDLLTIIYTSGTTGAPKGVMHTHSSVLHALEAASDWVMLDTAGNRFFS